MKRLTSILFIAIIITLLFASTALAAPSKTGGDWPPPFDYTLSQCVQGDLYSTFTLGEFSKLTALSYVELNDGEDNLDISINNYKTSRWRVTPREVVYTDTDGFKDVFVAWNVFIFPAWGYEVFDTCDWFVDHHTLVIPNMILFQNPDDPTMLNPIMTYGEPTVSLQQQELYNGFVGNAICQGPVYQWIDEQGTVDMEGYWPCDSMMKELGGERFPILCEAEEGETCNSLLGSLALTNSWFVEED